MVWLAGAIGLMIGAILLDGFGGGTAGAALGLIIGLALRSRGQAASALLRHAGPLAASAADEAAIGSSQAVVDHAALNGRSGRPSIVGHEALPSPGAYRNTTSAILQRIDAIDRRLQAIEARLPVLADPGQRVENEPMQRSTEGLSAAVGDAAVQSADNEAMPRFVAALPPAVAATGVREPPLVTAGTAPVDTPPQRGGSRPGSAASTPAASSNALWAWLTGGNTLTRVGVVVLFFGVGFLLKYFAEEFTISIEWRLLAVALAGGSLVALGAWLARERPAYGLSLQGLGVGILYLTTFAALRLYAVLPPTAALALLVATAALTVALAVRANSQPLAGLAITGGFLAPFLIADRPEAPALLFGYFAILNAAIFVLAWFRAWRALNVLGFVFTFALGLLWGHRYYSPQHFAAVEPYLILFFVFYVTIAALYAKRVPLAARAPVDAVLVFGVPLIGFALQAALVRDLSYGIAISAAAIAAVYGGAFIVLRRRKEPGLALLSRTFLVLAIIFGTIAIPFAVDARSTSAWWALEAAAVYWIGCRQQQPLARAFALLLQIAAGIAFVLAGPPPGEKLFANASFFGTTVLALAALATARIADALRDQLSQKEKDFVAIVFAWGVAWWIGGGMFESHTQLPGGARTTAMLAWVAASVMLALASRNWLRWSRLAWAGAALLPAMALVALLAWRDTRTTLLVYGWLIWPAAWITQWWVLRAADALPATTTLTKRRTRAEFVASAHAMSAIALIAWSGWEASEWAGRWTPVGTVWIACAAGLPPIVYLASASRYAKRAWWPITAYADAYRVSAGSVVAALVSVWFVLVNVMSPGDPSPLPYVPLANPLDLTLLAALAVLFFWARRYSRMDERSLYGWLGAAIFLLVNAIVFRVVHQWFGVPWQWSPLFASRTLQAALTLTWTVTALPLMLVATRHGIRSLWMLGAALLGVVVGKLFIMDLAALSGLPRIVAFLGAGASLLVVGYVAPLPPATDRQRDVQSQR